MIQQFELLENLVSVFKVGTGFHITVNPDFINQQRRVLPISSNIRQFISSNYLDMILSKIGSPEINSITQRKIKNRQDNSKILFLIIIK